MKHHVNKTLLFLVSVLIFVLIVAVYRGKSQKEQSTQTTIINKTPIKVTVADTDSERTQGYSNHPPISYNEGMLFIFPFRGNYTFWMKDMLFDLDFIYIRSDHIVDIIENVKAPSNNNGEIVYVTSPEPFEKILEVKSGFIKKNKIKVGDRIQTK